MLKNDKKHEKIITIRGQYGSWATDIGELIAHKFNIDYVDRECITEVVKRLRTPSQSLEEKEMPPTMLLGLTYIGVKN